MSAARLLTCLESLDCVRTHSLAKVKRSLDRQPDCRGADEARRMGKVWRLAENHSTRARLHPISSPISAVGEPYWGKPDVRFDEGDQRTAARQIWLRHQTERSWQTVQKCLNW